MPPKKEEYEDVFNKMLGTNIQWRKLGIEELIELAVLFNHPEIFLTKLGIHPEAAAEDTKLVNSVAQMWAKEWHGPLATLYRKFSEKPPPPSPKNTPSPTQ